MPACRAFFALKASDSWKPTARGPDHEPVRNDVAEASRSREAGCAWNAHGCALIYI